ncbi:MAG: hypothetical protein H7Z21_06995 [Hymenobacter sp.]|nr:hypothetical protein [Hymenobacter sp.]
MIELLFVYNADSGLLNAAVDYFHKILSPATYTCSLCAVTYGNRGMRPDWREFVAQLPVQTIFLHRNELREKHPELAHYPLPAAFRRDAGNSWRLFLTSHELDHSNLPVLMQLVRNQVVPAAGPATPQRTTS